MDEKVNPVRNHPAVGTASAASGRLVSNGIKKILERGVEEIIEKDHLKAALESGQKTPRKTRH